MNSIFTVHSLHELNILVTSIVAHKLLEVGEVFSETIESETLLNQPSVRDEGAINGEVFKPEVIDVIEVNTEFMLNNSSGNNGGFVRFLEDFSESVNALVMFILKFTGPQQIDNNFRASNFMLKFLEIFPDGISLRGAGVSANDFGDDSFPPVRSAVNSNEGWCVFEMGDAGFMRFDAYFGFQTAVSAYNCCVF